MPMKKIDVDPTFDPEDGRYHMECDWSAVPGPGVVVVEAVASVMHCDPLELEPLQNVLDVDGVEAILTSRHVTPVTIDFEYGNALVTLSRGGAVIIEPLS